MPLDFAKKSYELHSLHEQQLSNGWRPFSSDQPTIDTLRGIRLQETISPLHKYFMDHTWLTVGDRGSDATYLKYKGVKNVICSNISVQNMSPVNNSEEYGFEIREINAESIDMEDDSVDVTLCKEAYHHFPRPPMAFYEFVRVAREAIILIEPAEKLGWRPLDGLKVVIKSILRSRSKIEHEFEASGNFLFRLSVSEVRKMAIALQLDSLAFRYLNTFYVGEIAERKASDFVGRLTQRCGETLQDVLCRLRLMNYGLVVMIVFKRRPSTALIETLKSRGYSFVQIPTNPYLRTA